MDIKEAINKTLSEEQKGLIKTLLSKVGFNTTPAVPAVPATPAAAATPVAKLSKDMKTADGAMTITIDGEMPVAGVAVIDKATGSPLADASYVLEDGSTIVVSGGLITSVTAAAAPVDQTAVQQAVASQFAKHKTEFEKLETKFATEIKTLKDLADSQAKQIEDLIVLNKPITEFMKAVVETPVNQTPKKEVKRLTSEEWDKMSGLEQARWKRENKD